MNGTILNIFIAPKAGDPMQPLQEVEAIAGRGLSGDRYCSGEGSWNNGKVGNRQVTFISARFFAESGFTCAESRRNIVTRDVELMGLINREFKIGAARFRGVKYCDPCGRPSQLAGKPFSFKGAFEDCGGLIAEVLEGGLIKVGDPIVVLPKPH